MKRDIFPVVIFLVFVFTASPAMANMAYIPPEAKLLSYDVTLINLETPIEKEKDGQKVIYKKAYLIRLLGEFPVSLAPAMELYIGQKRIEEFGGFPKGIYFMVFEKADLDDFEGKAISYRLQNNNMPEKQSLGKTFTTKDSDLTKEKTLFEALSAK